MWLLVERGSFIHWGQQPGIQYWYIYGWNEYQYLGMWKKKKVATVQMRIMAKLHSLLCMVTRFSLFFAIKWPTRSSEYFINFVKPNLWLVLFLHPKTMKLFQSVWFWNNLYSKEKDYSLSTLLEHLLFQPLQMFVVSGFVSAFSWRWKFSSSVQWE